MYTFPISTKISGPLRMFLAPSLNKSKDHLTIFNLIKFDPCDNLYLIDPWIIDIWCLGSCCRRQKPLIYGGHQGLAPNYRNCNGHKLIIEKTITNIVSQSRKIIKIYFSQSRKSINNFIFRSEKSEKSEMLGVSLSTVHCSIQYMLKWTHYVFCMLYLSKF